MDAKTYREQGAAGAARPPAWNTERGGVRLSDSVPPLPRKEERPAPRGRTPFPPLREDSPDSVLRRDRPEAPPPSPPPAAESLSPARPFVPAIPSAELPGQKSLEPPGEAPWRVAGEVLRTYIVCESEAGEVWLVDKHAAHERINFDRLKAA